MNLQTSNKPQIILSENKHTIDFQEIDRNNSIPHRKEKRRVYREMSDDAK